MFYTIFWINKHNQSSDSTCTGGKSSDSTCTGGKSSDSTCTGGKSSDSTCTGGKCHAWLFFRTGNSIRNVLF